MQKQTSSSSLNCSGLTEYILGRHSSLFIFLHLHSFAFITSYCDFQEFPVDSVWSFQTRVFLVRSYEQPRRCPRYEWISPFDVVFDNSNWGTFEWFLFSNPLFVQRIYVISRSSTQVALSSNSTHTNTDLSDANPPCCHHVGNVSDSTLPLVGALRPPRSIWIMEGNGCECKRVCSIVSMCV